MSEHKIENWKAVVPGFTVDNALAMRQITDLALKAQELYETADNVGKDIAPHLHNVVLKVEQTVREDKAYAHLNGDSGAIAQTVLDIVEGQFEEELTYARVQGYTGNQIPRAMYTAWNSIKGALQYGGSLLDLTTVSMCKKYKRDMKKKEQESKAAQYKELTDGPGTGGGGEGDAVPASLSCPEEYRKHIAAVVKALDEAFTMNAVQAESLAKSTVGKCNNMVNHARARLAGKVANG